MLPSALPAFSAPTQVRSLPRRAISSGVAAACASPAPSSILAATTAAPRGLIMRMQLAPSECVFDVERQIIAVGHDSALVDIRRRQVVDPGRADLEVAHVAEVCSQRQGLLAPAQALIGAAIDVLLPDAGEGQIPTAENAGVVQIGTQTQQRAGAGLSGVGVV